MSDFEIEPFSIEPFEVEPFTVEPFANETEGGSKGGGMRTTVSGVTGWGANAATGGMKIEGNPFVPAELRNPTGPGQPMEPMIRPFTMALSAPKPAEVRVPIPGEDTEAFIIWGKESNFFEQLLPGDPIVDPGRNLGPPGVEIKISDKDKDKPPKENDVNQPVVFTEMLRTGVFVKVKNPDDENQWVKVARIQRILFRGPQDRIFDFQLNPPSSDNEELDGSFVHISG